MIQPRINKAQGPLNVLGNDTYADHIIDFLECPNLGPSAGMHLFITAEDRLPPSFDLGIDSVLFEHGNDLLLDPFKLLVHLAVGKPPGLFLRF